MSIINLIAILLYSVVTLASMAACWTASRHRQPNWNRNVWLSLAVVFAMLIVMRGTGVEEWLRETMREALRSGGSYDDRRSVQGIIASSVLVTVAAIGAFWLYRATRRLSGRRNICAIAALLSGAAMLFLIGLRLISLHMIDAALYGALKLNWVGDIGTSLAVLVCAIRYTMLVRARP